MDLPKDLLDDIKLYCELNNILDIEEFTIKLTKQGLTIEKYGSTPSTKIVEKIVEKIVQVPIEKEVEKIVERIIEIPIEKEVYITDNSEIIQLSDKLIHIQRQNDELIIENKRLSNEIDLFKNEVEEITEKLKQEILKQKNNNFKKDIYGE